MPSNEVVINGSIKYEVPDSFMGPLDAYLKLVKEKCTPGEDQFSDDLNLRKDFSRRELQFIRERAFSLSTEITENTYRKRELVTLGDCADALDAIRAREDGQTSTDVYRPLTEVKPE